MKIKKYNPNTIQSNKTYILQKTNETNIQEFWVRL
jgi:hypothetical protein